MDREGDDYALLAHLRDDRFVIRLCHDRKYVWPEVLRSESVAVLQKVLALFVPIAWGLLVMRHRSRTMPQTPATAVMSPTQSEILRRRGYLAAGEPTVRDALLAVAKLGGHIERNGEPGWQVLSRGYLDLLLMEQAWDAALANLRPAERTSPPASSGPMPPESCDQ